LLCTFDKQTLYLEWLEYPQGWRASFIPLFLNTAHRLSAQRFNQFAPFSPAVFCINCITYNNGIGIDFEAFRPRVAKRKLADADAARVAAEGREQACQSKLAPAQ
jgi:hypothetical protein